MFAKKLVRNFKLIQSLPRSQLIKRCNHTDQYNVQNTQIGTKTYEGDGKTKAEILNKDLSYGVLVNSISKIGFRLSNDMMVIGPMIIFPRTVMSWNIERIEDINEKSLALFPLLEPKIDILVLGTGDHNVNTAFQKTIFAYMRKYNITMEVLPSEQACTTYNFLASEGRIVAAAIIPPLNLHVSEDDFSGYMLNRERKWELADY